MKQLDDYSSLELNEEEAAQVLEALDAREGLLRKLHSNGIKDGIVLPAHAVRVIISGPEDKETKSGFGMLQHLAYGSLNPRIHYLSDKPLSTRLQLAHQLLNGLKTMKDNHVIHKDIKLENVFIFEKAENEIECRLADFDEAMVVTDPESQFGVRTSEDGSMIESESMGSSFVYHPPEDGAAYREAGERGDYVGAEAIVYQSELYAMSNSILSIILADFIGDDEPEAEQVRKIAKNFNLSDELTNDLINFATDIRKINPLERITVEQAIERIRVILSKMQ